MGAKTLAKNSTVLALWQMKMKQQLYSKQNHCDLQADEHTCVISIEHKINK